MSARYYTIVRRRHSSLTTSHQEQLSNRPSFTEHIGYYRNKSSIVGGLNLSRHFSLTKLPLLQVLECGGRRLFKLCVDIQPMNERVHPWCCPRSAAAGTASPRPSTMRTRQRSRRPLGHEKEGGASSPQRSISASLEKKPWGR